MPERKAGVGTDLAKQRARLASEQETDRLVFEHARATETLFVRKGAPLGKDGRPRYPARDLLEENVCFHDTRIRS